MSFLSKVFLGWPEEWVQETGFAKVSGDPWFLGACNLNLHVGGRFLMSNEYLNRAKDVWFSYGKKTKELHCFWNGRFWHDYWNWDCNYKAILNWLQNADSCISSNTRTVLARKSFKLLLNPHDPKWYLVNSPCSGFYNVTHESLHSSETEYCVFKMRVK